MPRFRRRLRRVGYTSATNNINKKGLLSPFLVPYRATYYSEFFTEGSEGAAERSEGATEGQKRIAEGGGRISEALLSPPYRESRRY